MPVEAYNSIRKIECYHTLLHYTYQILASKLSDTLKNLILQIVVKAINNSASPDGIVPMLLVFSVYPCMLRDSLSSSSVIEQAEAI